MKLMNNCYPKHLCMGEARMKKTNKLTEQEGKQKSVNMERKNGGTKGERNKM